MGSGPTALLHISVIALAGLALLTKASEAGADWSLITARTLMVVAPLLVAFFLFQQQFINSFMRSGIK